MQQYTVALNVMTSLSVTKSDMMAVFGASPSHVEQNYNVVCWHFTSDIGSLVTYASVADQHRGLHDHVQALATTIHPVEPVQLNNGIRAISLIINVTFDTVTVTVRLPMQVLDLLKSKLAAFDVVIKYHPTHHDDDD